MIGEISATIAFGILAVFLVITGYRKGFFASKLRPWPVPIRLIHVVIAFAIYFAISFFFSSYGLFFLKEKMKLNYLQIASWLNFSVSFSILLALTCFLFLLPSQLRMGIFRRDENGPNLITNINNALYAWLLAFPLVLFLSQILELIVMNIFHMHNLPEQIAVKFLKSTFHQPLYFAIAVFSITILAPLIEETLFRGFLQSFIRQHLGSKQAIFITAVSFSLFHYAAGQGLGNISIIVSLFVLALFLGFIYEKQGSLSAPIFLHSAFNTISIINLYLFGCF